MAARAVYDDPVVNAAYNELRSQPGPPNDVIEQPALKSLMPLLRGKEVVDLGCGTGGMARWALEQDARSVKAFDSSEQMISEAKTLGGDCHLQYQQCRIENISIPDDSIDVVMSGLALHYIEDFGNLAKRIANWLREGGSVVFSVEHPIVTCSSRQWTEGTDGARLHWPVDRYLEEGGRIVQWLGVNMPREHRTIESYVNSLIDARLTIDAFSSLGRIVFWWPSGLSWRITPDVPRS